MSKPNDYCHFYCYLRKAEECIIHEKYLKENEKYSGKFVERQNSNVRWKVLQVTEEGFLLSRPNKENYLLDWDRFRKHWKVVD